MRAMNALRGITQGNRLEFDHDDGLPRASKAGFGVAALGASIEAIHTNWSRRSAYTGRQLREYSSAVFDHYHDIPAPTFWTAGAYMRGLRGDFQDILPFTGPDDAAAIITTDYVRDRDRGVRWIAAGALVTAGVVACLVASSARDA